MALFVLAVNKGLCATFRTVLEIMALVDEQPVDAQFFKSHRVILGALVVELFQPCLQRFAGALHLLDRKILRPLPLGVADGQQHLVDLPLQDLPLPLTGQGDLHQLTVADDNGVIIAGGNAGAQPAAIVLFKVPLGGHQNVGSRVELEPFCRPLLRDMIRHHDQRLGA